MHPSDAPPCHICGAEPRHQWIRYATVAEAELRAAEITQLQGRMLAVAEIEQRYGPAVVSVTGCAVHHLGDDPDDPDSGLERRALVHDADCAGHGECACDGVALDSRA